MSGRGKSQKSLALIDAAIRVLEEIQPTTVRSVCYQLFIKKLIAAMSKAETNKVGTQLVWAREEGLIPWEWIVDETREAERISTWDKPEDIINAAVRGYRKDYWQMQDNRVEVWSEKGTIRGTLSPVLKKYGVTFRVMHGYGSATALHDIAEETAENDKPLTVLYVGDWDPSGLQMSEIDLPDRLDRYGGEAEIVRVALDESDVADDTDLPNFEAVTKIGDSRYKWFVENYGHRCWEVDALSPVILRKRVEVNILAMLDIAVWDHAVEIERAEIESMQSVLGAPGRAFPCKPRNTRWMVVTMGELIRERLPDPVDYFSNTAGLKLTGPRNAKVKTTSCEFHGGSDSMRIWTLSGGFMCMNCNAKGGDVLAYHMAAHHMDFISAAKALGAWKDDDKPSKPRRPKSLSATDAIRVVAFESTLIAVAGGNIANGVTLTDKDRARVRIASRRINHISELFT